MKTKKVVAGLVSAVFIMGFSASALAADKVEAELRWWKTSLDANAKVGTNATNINFKDTLGMSDKNFTDIRFTIGEEKKMRVAYTKFDMSGQRNVGSVWFQGQNYTADVSSSLNIDYYRIGFIRPIKHTDTTKIDYIIDIKGFNFESKLDSNTNALHEKKSFSGALPAIGIAASTKLSPQLTGYAEITGLPFGGYGHLYDYEIGAKYQMSSNASLTAGYRVFDLEAKKDDDYAKIKLSGPYFSAEYKF